MLQTGYPSIDRPWMKYYPSEVKDITIPDCNMIEYLRRNNENRLSKVAINYFGKS